MVKVTLGGSGAKREEEEGFIPFLFPCPAGLHGETLPREVTAWILLLLTMVVLLLLLLLLLLMAALLLLLLTMKPLPLWLSLCLVRGAEEDWNGDSALTETAFDPGEQ